jgi:hypothetical protein
VNLLYDGALGVTPMTPTIGMGVKQILEKKQGLFRMNMMVFFDPLLVYL